MVPKIYKIIKQSIKYLTRLNNTKLAVYTNSVTTIYLIIS